MWTIPSNRRCCPRGALVSKTHCRWHVVLSSIAFTRWCQHYAAWRLRCKYNGVYRNFHLVGRHRQPAIPAQPFASLPFSSTFHPQKLITWTMMVMILTNQTVRPTGKILIRWSSKECQLPQSRLVFVCQLQSNG